MHLKTCLKTNRKRPNLFKIDAISLVLFCFFAMLSFFLLLQFTHFWANLLGDPAIASIESREPLTEEGITRAIDSRTKALEIMESSRARRELGQVYIRRALDVSLHSESSDADADLSIMHFRAALSRAPADHFAWFGLALAAAGTGNSSLAANSLEKAYQFGPYHPPMEQIRSQLGAILSQ